jgi:mannosyltransferase OCH1-like enzyme
MKEWISPIPLKVHLIWIGGDPPDYLKLFMKSFEKNMPEFEIKLWGNKDLTKKNFPLTYEYIKKAKKYQGKPMREDKDLGGHILRDINMKPYTHAKWAQITDLMRLEIVYRNGGFYFDTTFEILKPMYNLLNKKTKFVGCNEVPRFKNVSFLSNSFFGAIKKSPILKRLLSKSKLNKIRFDSIYVDNETGPSYLRSGIRTTDDFHIYPSKYFYPFVEEYDPGVDPPYRKAEKNKCHGKKKTKNKRKLKGKGFIEFPCKKYPKSFALKHWQLGKTWSIPPIYYIEE